MKRTALVFYVTLSIAGIPLNSVWHARGEDIRDFEIVRDTSRPVSKKAATMVISEAKCPEGKKVVSGGFSIVHGEGNPIHGADQVRVFQSVPKADGNGWYVRAWIYSNDAALYYQAVAICATIRGRE